MAKVRRLLSQIAAGEARLRETQFLAPCVAGGQVRVRVAKLVHTLDPLPRNFEGWGIFRALDERRAEVLGEPGLPEIARYLALLRPLRVRLAVPLCGRTWLAYPVNESDARQRGWRAQPLSVHLVTDGGVFEVVVGHSDGRSWWFGEMDRRADPKAAERLRRALGELTPPEDLRWKGLTPEARTAYDLAAQQAASFQPMMARRRDEKRLRDALRLGGGRLEDFRDRGDHWYVEWATRDGVRHSSAITKGDLTVVSAGICLAGRDRDFDLQSLVGVVEGAEAYD